MSENQMNGNAVSVYGQEGLDDFPVLKAFQQYIDAEQNKARKRMLMLCVFFGFLMTVMITVFLLVLKDVSGKNQSLNDRLIEYVMKSNDRQNVIVQQPAPATANDAALKAMTDTLVALQKQMSEQQEKAVAAQIAAAQSAASQTYAAPAEPTKAQTALQRKIDSETQRLEKETARIKAERERLAAEKESLRQQEIELHRRRLYPEYYEKLDAGKAPDAEAPAPARAKQQTREPQTANPPAQKQSAGGAISYFNAYADDDDADAKSGDDDIDALLDSLPPAEAEGPVRAKPQIRHPADKPRANKPVEKPVAKPVEQNPIAKPIEKVKSDPPAKATSTPMAADHFNVPLEINGETSDWLIPVQN